MSHDLSPVSNVLALAKQIELWVHTVDQPYHIITQHLRRIYSDV